MSTLSSRKGRDPNLPVDPQEQARSLARLAAFEPRAPVSRRALFKRTLLALALLVAVVLAVRGIQSYRIERAVAVERLAVELQPRNADAWKRLASAYEDHGALAKAENSYKKAIRKDAYPYYVKGTAMRGLARVLEQQGRGQEAEALRR